MKYAPEVSSSTQLIFWDQYCPQRAEGRARRLWIGNNAFPIRKRFLYRRQVLFSFRTRFIADTTTISLWSVLVDPCGEQPMPVVDLNDGLALPRVWPISPASRFSESRAQGHKSRSRVQNRWQSWAVHQEQLFVENGDYELYRLYIKACRYLESRLPRAMETMERKARARHRQEQQRLEQYYRQLSQEAMYPLRKLFRKLAVVSVRADLARSPETYASYADQIAKVKQEIETVETRYQEYLEEIRQDMNWRLDELEARYETRVQVSLAGVACIWAPYVEFTFHIPSLGDERTYLYNCMANRFADTLCDICEKLADHLIPCSCGNVVCESCHGLCPGCGKGMCADCAQDICYVCGSFICSRCIESCPLAADASRISSAGAKPLTSTICPPCLESHCRMCVSLSKYGCP